MSITAIILILLLHAVLIAALAVGCHLAEQRHYRRLKQKFNENNSHD